MKKFLSAVVAVAVATTAMAEGYQVNTLSAKQNGMGHTGTALKLGSESMIFNPGAMAYMQSNVDISGNFTAIFSSCTATNNGTKYETSNDPSTPMSFGAAFSIYKNLKAGISFYTPYGSGINWTDDWAGATLSQSVKLATYTVQPTIAWAITPKLSVGAGLMVTWATVDLNKGLVSPTSMDALIKAQGLPDSYLFGSTTPASVNLTGTSEMTFGVNVGVFYQPTQQLSFGASFRSKQSLKVKAGLATVSYANRIAETLLESKIGVLNQANFSAEMPAPYVLNVGVAYRPIQKLTLAFDAQLTGWSAYKTLEIDFLNDALNSFDQTLTKDYHNSMTYRIGAQYALTNRFDVRCGMMIDTTPVNYEHYNPETPGMTRLLPSVGFSFRPLKSLSIDVAGIYVAGLGANNATGQYDDFIKKIMNPTGDSMTNFTADYKLHAFIPSIGVSYKF
jgi:long-chain fatty acid transport protein